MNGAKIDDISSFDWREGDTCTCFESQLPYPRDGLGFQPYRPYRSMGTYQIYPTGKGKNAGLGDEPPGTQDDVGGDSGPDAMEGPSIASGPSSRTDDSFGNKDWDACNAQGDFERAPTDSVGGTGTEDPVAAARIQLRLLLS